MAADELVMLDEESEKEKGYNDIAIVLSNDTIIDRHTIFLNRSEALRIAVNILVQLDLKV